ncbi:MAG: hypothetical protein IPM29_12895 [Planctomycetes bacterium]|nr:hypothetical protein [Planctomycetota bacterium]
MLSAVHLRAVAAALAVSSGAATLAQAPARAARLDTRAMLDAVAALARDAGGLAGFGRDYAVRFDADGITYTPALGRRAPAPQRLAIRLGSLHRGDLALPIATGAEPRLDGRLARYQRSPSITECYEVRADGVEQTFVFTELPGRGDLVVRCQLAGELAGRGAADGDRALHFVAPGLGGVTIGAVTGIDARGATCSGGLRLVDGALELSLPAAFVDRAALPLVLDPLIGTRISVTAGSDDDRELDVAYDRTSDDFLVVWTRALAAGTTELRALEYGRSTGPGAAFLVASGNVIRRPRVASQNAVDRFVVVYESAPTLVGPATVLAQVVNADRTLGPNVAISPAGSYCVEPDVSGNAGSGFADVGGLIVYREQGAGIRLQQYTLNAGSTGTMVLGTRATVSTDPAAQHPRITRSAGNRAVVAFGLPGSVVAQATTIFGSVIGAGLSAPTGGSATPSPAVDGDGTQFLLAFDAELAPGDRDIRCMQLSWTGAGVMLAGYDAVSQRVGIDELQPAVAFLGPKYLVAWTVAAGFMSYEVHAKAMAPSGCNECGTELTLAGSLASEVLPAIASRRSGGAVADDALIAFASHSGQPPFEGNIDAWLFTPFSATLQTTTATGCGNPLSLQAVGQFSIGNAAFSLRLSTTDPNATLGFVSLGLGGPPLVCGSCSLVAPVDLLSGPLPGGVATFPLPVPCLTALLGARLDVQGGMVGSATNLCPLLRTLSTSSAIRLTVVE